MTEVLDDSVTFDFVTIVRKESYFCDWFTYAYE